MYIKLRGESFINKTARIWILAENSSSTIDVDHLLLLLLMVVQVVVLEMLVMMITASSTNERRYHSHSVIHIIIQGEKWARIPTWNNILLLLLLLLLLSLMLLIRCDGSRLRWWRPTATSRRRWEQTQIGWTDANAASTTTPTHRSNVGVRKQLFLFE